MYRKVITFCICFCSILCKGQNKIDIYRNKAEEMYLKRNYKEAFKFYEIAYKICKPSDYIRAANLCVDISSMYHLKGEYRNGVNKCNEGITKIKNQQNIPDSLVFKLYSSLGEMYKKLNYEDSSIHFFNKANIIIQGNSKVESQIPLYVLYHFQNQSAFYKSKGDYNKALTFVQKSISIAKSIGDKTEIALMENNLAGVYENLGRYDESIEHCLNAANNYKINDIQKVSIYSQLGSSYLAKKDYKNSLTHLNKSLALINAFNKNDKAQSNIEITCRILNHIGLALSGKGELNKALSYFDNAINLYEKKYGNKGRDIANSYLYRGHVFKKQHKYNDALNAYQQAIVALNVDFNSIEIDTNPVAKGSIYEKITLDALSNKAQLLYDLFRTSGKREYLDISLRTYIRTIDFAVNLRSSFETMTSKVFFTEKILPVYENAIEIARIKFRQNPSKENQGALFWILEESRASILADALKESAIKSKLIDTELLAKEIQLNKEITNARYKITREKDKDMLTELKNGLVEKEIQLSNLLKQFEQQYPEYYELKYKGGVISLPEFQKILDTETTLLSYYLKEDTLLCFVITPNDLKIIDTKVDKKNFKENIESLRNILRQNPDMNTYNSTPSISLYSTLITPVEKYIKSKVVISLDPALGYLPFEVLQKTQTSDYFFQKFSISYIYSASTIRKLDHVRKSDNYAVAFAPFISEQDKKILSDNQSIVFLPASKKEVDNLKGEKNMGKEATKSLFLENQEKYTIIHLATHAIADNENPENSYIAFSPIQKDYRLYIEELYNLQLDHAKLVILSACEAGNGKIYKSEGLMSLARGFASAGCKSVLTTLWNADDQSSAYLSEKLHYYLEKGEQIDKALQLTRLDYLASDYGKQNNHPYYWANFVLIGNTEAIYESGPIWQKVLPLLLVFIIGVITFYQRQSIFKLLQKNLPA